MTFNSNLNFNFNISSFSDVLILIAGTSVFFVLFCFGGGDIIDNGFNMF